MSLNRYNDRDKIGKDFVCVDGPVLPEHSRKDEEPSGVKCVDTSMRFTASQHRTKALPSSVNSSSTEWT